MQYQDKTELLKNATEVTSDFFIKNDPNEPFNRANLTMLADYLEGGKLKADFDMTLYSWDGWSAPDCGSAGCAVGHGPHAGILKLKSEDWDNYAERVFISKQSEWQWCFSSMWRQIDNTPQGAAKRIRCLLKHGSEAVDKIMNNGWDYMTKHYVEILNS